MRRNHERKLTSPVHFVSTIFFFFWSSSSRSLFFCRNRFSCSSFHSSKGVPSSGRGIKENRVLMIEERTGLPEVCPKSYSVRKISPRLHSREIVPFFFCGEKEFASVEEYFFSFLPVWPLGRVWILWENFFQALWFPTQQTGLMRSRNSRFPNE